MKFYNIKMLVIFDHGAVLEFALQLDTISELFGLVKDNMVKLEYDLWMIEHNKSIHSLCHS